jgi:hypothetical protein
MLLTAFLPEYEMEGGMYAEWPWFGMLNQA